MRILDYSTCICGCNLSCKRTWSALDSLQQCARSWPTYWKCFCFLHSAPACLDAGIRPGN